MPKQVTFDEPPVYQVSIYPSLPDVSVDPITGTTYANAYVVAGAGQHRIGLSIVGNAAPGVVSIPFSLGGTATGDDYTVLTASPILVEPGVSSAEILLDIPANADFHLPRVLTVTLGEATNATPGDVLDYRLEIRASATAPAVDFNVPTSSATLPSTPGNIAVDLSAASDSPTLVYFEVDGSSTADPSDYTITASPLTIPAGSTSGNIVVTPDGASAFETVSVSIVNDTRSSQVNQWAFSPYLHLVQGSAYGAYPTDNVYLADATNGSGPVIAASVEGTTPDGLDSAYLLAMTGYAASSPYVTKTDGAAATGHASTVTALSAQNVFSVYAHRPTAATRRAQEWGLELLDTATGTARRAVFAWSGTTPVQVSGTGLTASGALSGEPYDDDALGNGWHRIYIRYDAPAAELGHVVELRLYPFWNGTYSVATNVGRGVVFAWPQYERSVTTPSAYQRVDGERYYPYGGAYASGTLTNLLTFV